MSDKMLITGRKKRIGIGIENYKEIVDKDCYYIDKTLLIKEIIDNGGKVKLFTRPRRFGKTLALSMLRTFFENEMDVHGNAIDNSSYFVGMKIMEAGDSYAQHMGQYPVIKLSLKSAKQPDFMTAYECLKEEIAGEYKRHRYVLDSSCILETDKEKYRAIMNCDAEYNQYATSLKFLSECLSQYHNKNTIILMDEYDVPLENAWFAGFYEQMTGFIRSLFESALKTNDFLEFAVITGCLRISKESIFTGLNNLEIISILSVEYAEYFGFTESEVDEMLRVYELEEK